MARVGDVTGEDLSGGREFQEWDVGGEEDIDVAGEIGIGPGDLGTGAGGGGDDVRDLGDVHDANTLVVAVGNEQVTGSIHRQARGGIQLGAGGGASVPHV